MTNVEKAWDIISVTNANQVYDVVDFDALHEALLEDLLTMSQWKDEQVKQLLVEKTKLLSSSAAQDSVKRCAIEEIYRELFNEELPNSNPYII